MDSESEDTSPVVNAALAANEETKKSKKERTKSSAVIKTVTESTERNDLAVAEFESSSLENTNDFLAENIIHESVDAFFDSGAISEAPKKVELMFTDAETMPVVTKRNNTADIKDFVDLPIKVMNQSNIIGVKAGFYVIANVYKNKKYLNAFIETLKQQGLNPRKFYNKENGLNYVYLANFNFKEDAKMAYASNLDGKYGGEKWIMQIEDHSAIVDNMYSSK